MNAAIEPLIDATQAARMLKLHPVTVREMASRGAIPGLKIGKGMALPRIFPRRYGLPGR